MRVFFRGRTWRAKKHTQRGDLPVASSSKTNGIDPREMPFPALSSAWRYQGRHRKSVNCKRIRVGPGAVSHFSYPARSRKGGPEHGARDISWRPIGDLWTESLSHRAARRGDTEKRNTILFRYHRCSHYPKRSQYLLFLQRNRARRRYAVVCWARQPRFPGEFNEELKINSPTHAAIRL